VKVVILDQELPQGDEGLFSQAQRTLQTGSPRSPALFDLAICYTIDCFWGVKFAETLRLPVLWHIEQSVAQDQVARPSDSHHQLEHELKQVDSVIFETETALRACDPAGLRENFEVIFNSVNINAIDRFCEEQDPTALKRKHGIDPSHSVISMIGPISPNNGQLLFLEAVCGLLSQYEDVPAVSFLVIGEDKADYAKFLRSTISPQAKHFHIIETRASYDYFRLTDVFVCPTLVTAPPRVLLEAMGFKLGIICMESPGIEEAIGNSNEGIIVPHGDVGALAHQIRTLVQNPEVRRSLGLKAHAKATRLFNSERQFPRLLKLAKEVVARHF
jgi:glycosyltransferase involved in cell wall biosynthesis